MLSTISSNRQFTCSATSSLTLLETAFLSGMYKQTDLLTWFFYISEFHGAVHEVTEDPSHPLLWFLIFFWQFLICDSAHKPEMNSHWGLSLFHSPLHSLSFSLTIYLPIYVCLFLLSSNAGTNCTFNKHFSAIQLLAMTFRVHLHTTVYIMA